MPERFNLEYVGADGQKHRPVVIHRAPFGSLERLVGMLIEHYAGEFPLWLAPVQVAVLPITDGLLGYAQSVVEELKQKNVRVELDDRNEKVSYKIRDWETKKVPYMLVLGKKEEAGKSVSVRRHKQGDLGVMSIQDFLKRVLDEIDRKIVNT
jgi:threonyl-tRNA synthetase